MLTIASIAECAAVPAGIALLQEVCNSVGFLARVEQLIHGHFHIVVGDLDSCELGHGIDVGKGLVGTLSI